MSDDEFRREVLDELHALRSEIGRLTVAMAETLAEVQALRRDLDAARSGQAVDTPHHPTLIVLH